ncbi:MAG: hypothetical protein Q7K35_03035 [bacterium]|nr:hypothetical protein [bacterium]
MTLKVRRILSLIFILLFLAITPVVVLYAAGFKLSKNGFFIQRTGMFIVDSNPRGAKILINGQVQKKLISSIFNKNDFITTPAKIKNLLPGEYDLALKLNGYWNWQKKLSINPGASTFIEDIYLFKNDLPIQIAPAGVKSINLSPNNNQALILSAGQITFLNLEDETKKSISQNNLKGKNITWSGDGQKLIIDNYLYDLNNLNINIGPNKPLDGLNYKWQNDNLYFQNKTSIYRLNSANLPTEIIANKKFNDFLTKDRYLYLINQSKPTASSLEIINIETGAQIKNIDLPASNNYSFINPEQNLINLYDNDHKILYLINPLAANYSPLVEVINNVKTTFWVNNNLLLYAGDYEIWLYNLETKKQTLITRISEEINSVVMHPNKNYIIYSTGQTINAIELDEREKRNIVELARFDLIESFGLNADGDILYFSGKVGNIEGLYKLLIQ